PEASNAITGTLDQNHLRIALNTPTTERVPVLINTTFHPNWQRADGASVYAATPFAMLTFVDRTTELTFARRQSERLALVGSAIALLALCCFVAWPMAATTVHELLRHVRLPRFARWTTR